VNDTAGDTTPEYGGVPLREFLRMLAAPQAEPAAGAAAGTALGMAAALCTMCARISARHLPWAGPLADDCESGWQRALTLARTDGDSYRAVIAARRAPDGPGTQERHQRIARALSQASAIPMEIAELGARVAAIAATLASDGYPPVRGDAVTAAALAAAAAAAAASLVAINLASAGDDDRPGRAARLSADAAAHALRARASIR
jgi:formiminotetrahydrofolate cyclodeaminase